ncbi:MAG: diphthine synthase [Nanoarchaeota archaeon]|nr:diphthine synthase [Nanoarchaeota archaeon]MBU1445270.1 diphthine synthase [Nanoarchaeota archaeon]MBU2406955.1 diphthine synthase [Nanoarchaeota archaeon]MBU2420466.1 diphthine synthase [Nanoarchaeota archaeon]MBU2475108.1 diphthine synthase [Nanoarchaeota archaeon]
MTLYFIGLGLNDEKDITLKGLEAIKKCKYIYLEYYTSILPTSIKKLEKLYKKKITVADRDLVEKKADEMLEKAKKSNVAFLVIGDIFSATTHVDLLQRAREKKIKIEFIHNASITSAIGVVGLEVYKYGKITSIPFHETKTPIQVLDQNQKQELHTLFLLDLDPITKKFLSINNAIEFLLKNNVKDQLAIACSRIGNKNQTIKVDKLSKLNKIKWDKFPQCLIIPGKLHFMEEEALQQWK